MAAVAAAIPATWRRGLVERADLPRFLFEPEDIIVVVGQDGLVANVAKYLDGQCVVGINADPARNPGSWSRIRRRPRGRSCRRRAGPGPRPPGSPWSAPVTDDGQELTALNEIYIGSASHQTARYILRH